MLDKTIWMRFLITGNLIILLFLLGGCVTREIEYIKTVDYVYKNNSGVDLVLEVYNSKDELIKSYNISNGNEIKTNTTKIEGPAVFYYSSSEDEVGSSIIVRFNDDKCLYYAKDNLDKIFTIEEYDNYSEKLLKQKKYTLFYTIKIEDYSLAVDCN